MCELRKYDIPELEILKNKACDSWDLNPVAIPRDKEGKVMLMHNPIGANCGSCINYIYSDSKCKVL